MTATPLLLPAPHPATEGHFPGEPILPGVVLLDEALRVIEQATGTDATHWRVASVKFLSPATPGEPLFLERERLTSGAIRFTIVSGGRTVARGEAVPFSEDT